MNRDIEMPSTPLIISNHDNFLETIEERSPVLRVLFNDLARFAN